MSNFKLFTMLQQLPEKIVTSTGAALDRAVIEGVEHIKINENSVTVDPEFWIGRFNRKVCNEQKR